MMLKQTERIEFMNQCTTVLRSTVVSLGSFIRNCCKKCKTKTRQGKIISDRLD